MSNKQFDWVPIYKEFAVKLLSYKKNRSDLVDKVKQIFVLSGIDMPKLEMDNELVDIDPFTVYSLFNKKLLPQNRTAILSAIKELFGLSESLPSSYDGIPVLNPQRAAYYPFLAERKDEDIDDHWNLFEAALKYASDSSEQNRNLFSDAFTKSVKVKYVGNAKLSMGLFWIAPESYINLDSCNVKYIYKSNKFPDDLVKALPDVSDQLTGQAYLDIIEKIKTYLSSGSVPFSSFVELSYTAWLDSSKAETNGGKSSSVRYWLYSPGENACKWEEFYAKGIMAINWTEMGDLSLLPDREEMRAKMKELYSSDSSYMHDSLATWEFAYVMKPGDVVYVKKGLRDLVGRGIVMSEYMFDESASEFGHIREVNWTHVGEWKNAYKQVQKTLTEITKEKDYKKLEVLFGIEGTGGEEAMDSVSLQVEWWPALEEYSPGFSKEDWLNILNNKDIIGPVWGGALAAFYGMGGAATCSQVGEKYDRSPYGISGICSNLGRSIYKTTNCPILFRENGQKCYWPIMFQGKNAGSDVVGAYIWKLRPELYDALTEYDIMRYEWKKKDPKDDKNYWWLNANPHIWSFAATAVGEIQTYTLFNENGNKRRIFQNFLDAKAGDIVIGYETTPVKQIVALGKISAPQDGKEIAFEKTEDLAVPIDYSTLKECSGLVDMEYFQNPQGSFFKLSKDEYEIIIDIIREANPTQRDQQIKAYTRDDFLNDVYMTEDSYNKMVAVLRNKKNIILQGAPGVGKTYAAMRLAYSMIGKEDDDRIEFVQFHQNYSYEDFVMGYKPMEDGFELRQGIFYRFCLKAFSDPEKKPYFFIIDEINRGNMSKIFGELLMLIEKDYRGKQHKATLAYSGMPFSVPENLYIIGMMNTADRSLAMIDYALRRRFSFFDLKPGFDSDGFIAYMKKLNSDKFNKLIEKIRELNAEIESDKSLGKGFCIGHSYFCGQKECKDEWINAVIDYDILPMLNEYWFDDPKRVNDWDKILHGVLK